MKLLVMQLSPPSRHSIPLWSKYSPQHPVLKHPLSVIDVFWGTKRLAVVRTDVSEIISLPSSGFIRVIGFHSCVTVESLLISLPIEGYYVG
jgi:hypothetical protein